ncbi:hypothetical protein [Marinitenerispora sediminis]|uniref:Uncharacterized protein n=1 Tax=Marinitenerispora sediminis TaxID=1931232 RepID=A0A368T849_9ACTN|nr:hypothetical protein [Marinitenerispora sediminis]RCV47914.1 hypothetical protein DEF28_25000 [Marinitenerispora sediminis]RCV60492.1 hypothetical protein DEF24_06825 [Marinitenerispora sediminis]RCV61043.1 hypothetical protein DEF23_03255 [Marinitenerispora sediminis]
MRLTPGRLLARLTVVPVVALGAWLLVAFPLLLAGQFTPLAGLVVGLPAVVAALAVVPRLVPDLPEEETPWWPVAAVVLVTLAFAVVQVLYHSEQLVIRRDPASYAQFTAWIAQHGSLPIPQSRDLIAGDDPALSYDSAAYYQVGDVIWPQFLAGAPLILSVGYWLGGLDGMLVAAPLLGALGVLTFAGLAARLVGSRWAPLAALVLAVSLPEQWVSRSTYSEPAAQVLLLGALVLGHDALTREVGARERWGVPHALAAAAGLAFGLGLVVRIDALRDILPVVAFVGLLLLARRGQAVPLLAGLAVGLGYGLVAGFGLSRPYLVYLSDSLRPLLLISGAVVVAVALGTALLWRRGLPRPDRWPWLPTAAAGLAVLVMAGFAVRPLIHVERGHGDDITGIYIGQVQEIEGLAVDPDRTYEEMTLYWVGWYVGLTTVLFATVGVALLLRRVLAGREPSWVLPLMMLTWTVAATLLRPAITPDHPWASRRLVVLVIPAFVLLAVWFAARATRWVREHPVRPPAWLPGGVAALGAVAVLLPTAVTAAGIMSYRTDVGSVAATGRLCAAIPEDGSVLVVDAATNSKFAQLIRGMCGAPTAHVSPADPETVRRVVAEVRERGRTPVIAADSREGLLPHLPASVRTEHAFDVHTEQDPSTLMRPPDGPWAFNGDVWVAVVPEAGPNRAVR